MRGAASGREARRIVIRDERDGEASRARSRDRALIRDARRIVNSDEKSNTEELRIKSRVERIEQS